MHQIPQLNRRVLHGTLVMLERSAGKLARSVLRGPGGREPTWLPGDREMRTMQFHANHVSTSVAGDYYQALFEASEDTSDPASPYLLIQRQFERPDGGRCSLETHDETYTGHFRLRRIEFALDRIVIELERSRENVVQVTFNLAASDFEEARRVVKVISGEREAP